MRIAFAGNPNSGKTTMYNALTGRNEKVGNWAGVTVDKKEHPVKKEYAGGAQLIGSLFFTTQLLELGIPVVVALNKSDINERKKTQINEALLSKKLGCPVVETVSTSAEGLKAVVQAAVSLLGKGQTAPYSQGDIDLTSKQAVSVADRKRFEFVNSIVKAVESRTVRTRDKNFQDKIDAVLTHPVAGLPIFAVIMFLVFHISQSDGSLGLGVWLADLLVGWLEAFQAWVGELVSGSAPILQALLVDGIIGGVAAVVGFLPLVMVMYFLIALLEDCGYMARATVVLDPIFKKVGLSGKSVIPFVIGTGCAIPGVMACRTIRNERERRATAMLAPFMPCGAKLPVIALFAGAFFDDASWVGTTMYFVGIILILVGAVLVNKIAGHKARKSFFIIELPEYKLPSVKRAFTSMCSRGWAYIVKAGTVILVCNTVVQIMQSFTWSFQEAEVASESILATIANPIAYLLVPIVGVVSWQLAAAAVTGFIAKENVVGTLAVCFVGLENLIDTEELALMEGAGAEVAGVMAITKIAALAYLMFNLFSPPCFAALGAMNSEIKDRKWFWGGIALQFATGYTVAYLVYTVGTLITDPASLNVVAAIIGLAVVVAIGVVIAGLIKNANKSLQKEYALSGK